MRPYHILRIQVPEGIDRRGNESEEAKAKGRVSAGASSVLAYSQWAFHQLRVKMQKPDVGEWVQVLKQRYAGMKLVAG